MAIAASLALPLLGLPVRGAAMSKVSFPQWPVRLTRRLERGLGDGASLIVSRTWECRFELAGSGATIAARQMAVDVVAPPALSALAEIERRREASGLFPMQLDASGAIVGWSQNQTDLDHAVAAARAAIESKDLQARQEDDAKRYVAAMGRTAAAVVSQVPRDLLFPRAGERREERALDLPGGGKGMYELTVRASAQPASGLLKSSERHIVTRVGQSSRTSSESWSIG